MRITEIISKSDFIISIGAFVAFDSVKVNDCILEAIAKNNAEFIYMHPVDNVDVKMFYTQFVKYEVGSEEGICSLLAQALVKNSNENVQAFLNDLDMGYLSAESSAGEEEFDEIFTRSENKNNKTLIIGDDIKTHEEKNNIVKLISLIKKYTDITCLALDEDLQTMIDSCDDENLSEVEDLKSYNGILLYRYEDNINTDLLLGSESFARVAKISNGDEILINYKNDKIQRSFKIDKNLQGTIALCAIPSNLEDEIFNKYRYKQIKIQKVKTNE